MFPTSRLLLFVLCAGFGPLLHASASPGVPVWILSNGFHSSLVLRARDVPFRGELTAEPADELVIGWGANDLYRGHVNPWAISKAMVSDKCIIHVVPVRGAVRQRFPHSDLVRLRLSSAQLRRLLREVDGSFASAPGHRRLPLGQGYYADSRFYASRERFYFPNMCNLWLAKSFRRSGVPFILSGAVFAQGLVGQAAQMGVWEQHRNGPSDGF